MKVSSAIFFPLIAGAIAIAVGVGLMNTTAAGFLSFGLMMVFGAFAALFFRAYFGVYFD